MGRRRFRRSLRLSVAVRHWAVTVGVVGTVAVTLIRFVGLA